MEVASELMFSPSSPPHCLVCWLFVFVPSVADLWSPSPLSKGRSCRIRDDVMTIGPRALSGCELAPAAKRRFEVRSVASPLNKGEVVVAARPYCAATRRFNGGGERVDVLAILSASLRSGASPLNKGEVVVASRPFGAATRRFNGGGERVDVLAIAVFEANGETKRREATTISPRKWRELSPWAKREARSRSDQLPLSIGLSLDHKSAFSNCFESL